MTRPSPITSEILDEIERLMERLREIGSMPVGAGPVAREAASLIASQQEEIEMLQAERERADGMDGAVVDAIRQMLKAADVPLSAFIDDHVGNAIAQREEARAALASSQARIEQLEPIVRQARELLADLTGDNASLSTLHLYARAVEIEARARAALASRVSG